ARLTQSPYRMLGVTLDFNQRFVIVTGAVSLTVNCDSLGITAGSPRVASTTPAPPAPPAPAPIAAPLPPPAIAPIAAPIPAPIPTFAASFVLLLLASFVYKVVSRFTLRPSAKVRLSNLTEMKATPFTRPPGSELTTTPSTGAPFFAITQSPSTIELAKLAVNL